MAVDTAAKRASILGLGLVAALVLPPPDGAISDGDRQHVAFTYPLAGAGGGASEDVLHTWTESRVPASSTTRRVPHTEAVFRGPRYTAEPIDGD